MQTQLFFLSACISISCLFESTAQSGAPHPEFGTFSGTVYEMSSTTYKTPKGTEITSLLERYGPHVYDYEKLQDITLDEINVPDTECSKGFFPGGVKRQTKFAMVLYSEVEIKTKACYEFSLNSDDGSVLWIDEKLVVNNDGGHKMQMTKDSTVLEPGKHKVKLWYFQSYPNRYGIQLDGRIVGKADVCGVQPVAEKKYDFNSKVLFAMGSATMKKEAKTDLLSVFSALDLKTISEIEIVGHTDSSGSEKANYQLSKARAQAVKILLVNNLGFDEQTLPKIKSIGAGPSQPVATNDTREGRAQNRRVELIIKS